MKVNRSRLRKLAEISLVWEVEDVSFEKELDDEESKKWIREQLAAGNLWAWCTAHVTVSYMGESGDSYLGCCSYESKESFKADSGYYPGMIDDALDELARCIEELTADPCLFDNSEHDPKTCIQCVADECA